MLFPCQCHWRHVCQKSVNRSVQIVNFDLCQSTDFDKLQHLTILVSDIGFNLNNIQRSIPKSTATRNLESAVGLCQRK